MDRLVEYAVDGHVARLTLNSPHNRNALSTALVTAGAIVAIATPNPIESCCAVACSVLASRICAAGTSVNATVE